MRILCIDHEGNTIELNDHEAAQLLLIINTRENAIVRMKSNGTLKELDRTVRDFLHRNNEWIGAVIDENSN